MLPLKDNTPSKHFPIVNWIIIITNLAVFIFQLSLNDTQLSAFFYKYGMVPGTINSEISNATDGFRLGLLTPFLTNMFIHGGFLHFISNMWMLYIFGDNVEDKMGSFRYLFFYLITGILASLTHFILYINSPVPTIGASGAISGVMAAYMFLFPRNKILTFIPIFIIIPLLVPIPAFIFIGIWFLGQLFSGTMHLFHGTATEIAFWAHIGGFISGLIFYKFFLRKQKWTFSIN